jgi:hypothetical protein
MEVGECEYRDDGIVQLVLGDEFGGEIDGGNAVGVGEG